MLGLGLGVARTSAAEPSADERARLPELLRKGEQAAKAEDWAGCAGALWDALAIEDSARIAGDLGLCEEHAGRFGDAANHLHRALAEATPGMQTKEPWRSYQAAVRRLHWRVAEVLIMVTPSDARVVVDGRPYGKAGGRLIAMSYGKHTVVARAEGYEDASETRLVTPAGVPVIQLDLKPKPMAPAPPPPPPPASAPAAPRADARVTLHAEATAAPNASFPCLPTGSVRGVLFPLACTAAAAFVASAATTIGFEVHAASMRAALLQHGFDPSGCAPGHPEAGSAECVEIRSRVQQRTDAANVMIGTGVTAALLAAGVGLSIALEPRGARVTAAASTSGGGIVVQGAW